MGSRFSPTIDPTPCNCASLRRASRHVSQIYDRHLAAEGLRVNQYSILAMLGRVGTLSINDLAHAMVMDRTTLGRSIRPLQRDGLVGVEKGLDARTRRLALTQMGRDRLEAARPHWVRAQADFEAAFGPTNAADLRFVLHRAVTVASPARDLAPLH